MASRRRRWLLPHEHGAYAQLLVPLATAFVLGRPTLAAVAIAIAACFAFVATQPLRTVLRRRRNAEQTAAARWLAITATIAIAAGATGLALAPAAIVPALVVAVPGAIALAITWRRSEHTLVGEIVAAAALAGASVPTSIAAGLDPTRALAIWAAWAIGFAATVIAVHRVLDHKRAPGGGHLAIAATAVIALASLGATLARIEAWIVVPLAIVATIVAIRPPPVTRLRTVGVVLVVASIVSSAVVSAHVLST
ncbi:MAG TPA: YwiC-like family protein [Kofleriaceae bacterium]|nr:YwiC-like family protein [Kofleriaceae bacterium]